jgi:hypothetical protein
VLDVRVNEHRLGERAIKWGLLSPAEALERKKLAGCAKLTNPAIA